MVFAWSVMPADIASTWPVIVIMGPTASGKTQFSFDFADACSIPCEIISVDSAMIYKGMDIGTAKPSLQERERLTHHLIDIREPTQSYSVAEFIKDADELIVQIRKRGHIPLLVGGTMMYHHAFVSGLAALPQANIEIRESIVQEANYFGWPHLHQKLMAIDPLAASRIHPNDPIRITRALEVCTLTQKPMSELQSHTARAHDYPLIMVNIMPRSRKTLHERIQNRLERMFENGFVEEVDRILKTPGIDVESAAMRSVGYKQVALFLSGEIDYQEAKDKTLFATRQFAKRQMTWLRRYFPQVHTFYSDESDHLVQEFIDNFLN
jgi:tRNA dimethylallyltransferase